MLRALLTEAAAVGRPLFSLFSHPAGTLFGARTALVMDCFASGRARMCESHSHLCGPCLHARPWTAAVG